eukprot:CAMPEP_0206541538 /NCGR_PEP_ID=MMETSP0325_2-20121206/9674_1 /ASSEMBLY_ACC=CAM_ASM_000347 /TAXON_ID=2866 /ORGANISM="Crypthecodinium cohnii, Strain Seligo" /LENGTH=221 /DNA_ID=CAMNT_0054039499 /DNA_START=89 /DNA_END=751 /DNA_ORIENTATION=+
MASKALSTTIARKLLRSSGQRRFGNVSRTLRGPQGVGGWFTEKMQRLASDLRADKSEADKDKEAVDNAIAQIGFANHRGKGRWEIKGTEEKGYGIFTRKPFAKDEMVFSARALWKSPRRTSHSLQTNWEEHIIMDAPAIFLNHSCEATVGLLPNEQGAYDFVALRPLEVGEEIVIDYGMAEFKPTAIEKCLCGTPACRGTKINFEDSREVIRAKYGKYYAP